MVRILLIIVLSLFLSNFAHAFEQKFLLCKDKSIVPEKDINGFKNKFFLDEGEVLIINYRDSITKIFGEYMDYIVQFTLIDKRESYEFEYPKNVFDAATPRFLDFKDKSFYDIQSGEEYIFINGKISKITLEGYIYYKKKYPNKPRTARSKTKDYLSVSFSCKEVKKKI